MGLKGIYEGRSSTRTLNTGELDPVAGRELPRTTRTSPQVTPQAARRHHVVRRREVHRRRREVHASRCSATIAPTSTYSGTYKEYAQGRHGHRSADRQSSTLTKPAPRFFRDNPGPSAMRTTRSSCPSTSGQARTRRPSPRTSTSPRTGRAARRRTSIVSVHRAAADRRPLRQVVGRHVRASRRSPAGTRAPDLIPVASRRGHGRSCTSPTAIDYGNPLQPGTFVGAQAQNGSCSRGPDTGPVWGALTAAATASSSTA